MREEFWASLFGFTAAVFGFLTGAFGLVWSQGGIVLDTPWVLAFLAGAGGVIALLYRALITSKDHLISQNEKLYALAAAAKDAELIEQRGMKESYQEIAREAIKSATETTNYYRQKEGKPPLLVTSPVVSESHSPSTALQRERAAIQTLRAAMAHIKVVTGQEPREEPPKANETGAPDGGIDVTIAKPAVDAKKPATEPAQDQINLTGSMEVHADKVVIQEKAKDPK